jgi:hypothetical protein
LFSAVYDDEDSYYELLWQLAIRPRHVWLSFYCLEEQEQKSQQQVTKYCECLQRAPAINTTNNLHLSLSIAHKYAADYGSADEIAALQVPFLVDKTPFFKSNACI